ncbi:MAG: hypothetical protein SGPRY_000558 [Prymnesium sp.]
MHAQPPTSPRTSSQVQMTAAAFKAPPPLALEHGYANEEAEARNMAPPKHGWFEIVNKNKEGEIIAVLVAENAAELSVNGRDVHGYLSSHIRLMPESTVLSGTFDDRVEILQIALFYGAKYKTVERCRIGAVNENFEFLKVRFAYIAHVAVHALRYVFVMPEGWCALHSTGISSAVPCKKRDGQVQKWRAGIATWDRRNVLII